MPDAEAGDAEASYRIFLILAHCAAQPASREELDARVLTGLQTRTDGAQRLADPVRWAERLQADFAACAERSTQQRAAAHDWLTRAAKLGHLEAQLRFTATPVPGWSALSDAQIAAHRRAALNFTEAAWRQGSVDAAQRLALLYETGIVVERDVVEALAYARAVAAVLPDGPRARHNQRFAAFLERQLRPADVEAAQRRADALLAVPARCCSTFAPQPP